MDILGSIIENGDKIGSYVLLLIFIFLIIYGSATNRLEFGSSVKEKDDALKAAKEALDVANNELTDKKIELMKYQIERELLWRNSQPLTPGQQIPMAPQEKAE